jgi:hypothetical protein
LGAGITAPFWGPCYLLEGAGDCAPPAYFPGHPYALPYSNFLDQEQGLPSNELNRAYLDPERLKVWSFRGAVEDGYDFDGLNRTGARLRLDSTSRVGITTNWDFYHEWLPGGRTDDLVLGDLELTYRFAQCEWMQMYSGVGGRGMFSRPRCRGGFNFLYAAEIYPIRPVVITASAELGNLGTAFTSRLRSTVGVQMHRVEAYVGYDWVNIGGVSLSGPMLGLRISF